MHENIKIRLTRRTSVFGVAAFLGFIVSSGPALADWNYTKWGMSIAEVIVAGKGDVSRLSDEQVKSESTFGIPCRAQSLTPITMGSIVFKKVNFCFDANGKLASVDLISEGDKFEMTDRALASTFGVPALSDGGPIPERIYNDKTKGNSLRLIRVASTILSYTKIPTGF